MDLVSPAVLWLSYVTSNLAALLMVLSSRLKPHLGRLLYFLLFGWAAFVNYRTAQVQPEIYLIYSELAIIPLYSTFIKGWFASHIQPVVFTIATIQLLIALSMWSKGWLFKIGSIAGILFLFMVAPLGIASSFPATLIMALGLWMLLLGETNYYLWPKLLNHFPARGRRFSDEVDYP